MNDRAARTLDLNFLSHSETKLFEISIFVVETNNVRPSKKILSYVNSYFDSAAPYPVIAFLPTLNSKSLLLKPRFF